jgi:excisionase family DNA binding protein
MDAANETPLQPGSVESNRQLPDFDLSKVNFRLCEWVHHFLDATSHRHLWPVFRDMFHAQDLVATPATEGVIYNAILEHDELLWRFALALVREIQRRETSPGDLLTVAEAAVHADVGDATIRRWLRGKKLSARRVQPSGRLLIQRADIDAFRTAEPANVTPESVVDSKAQSAADGRDPKG